ncbi:MAG TPA: NAD(P)-dependent oxidoreductase [Sphingomicrobium sp.]|nr:NAD(P)-dependent oxidoreductase [Sphingomicrobium sp.]
MRRILITGATGLLGSHLVRLLEGEAELHAWRGDLSRGLESASLPNRLDAVVHLAQSRRFREFPEAAGEVVRVNTLAAFELAQHALSAGATHFIYASSGGVYAPRAEPLAEDAPIADAASMTFYAATKLAAERLLAPFATRLNLVILRPFFIYGPGQDRSMLIPKLINAVNFGDLVRLAGAEGLRLNPVHAKDAAAAARAALELDGSYTINVAGPEVLTLREIVEEIARHLGREPQFDVDHDERPADLVGDTRRMVQLLHAPCERIRDRIGELVE